MALDISSPLPTVGGDLGTWGTKLNTAITEIINEAGKDSDIVSLQSTKALQGTAYSNLENNVKIVQGVPAGGKMYLGNSLQTGAVKIKLPKNKTSTMFKFRVRMDGYSTGGKQSNTEYIVKGLNNTNGFGVNADEISNCQVTVVKDNPSTMSPVFYFCTGATEDYILIGEITDTHSFKSVVIDDVEIHHQGIIDDWSKDWAISLVTTLETLTSTYKVAVTPSLNATHLEGYQSTETGEASKVARFTSSGYLKGLFQTIKEYTYDNLTKKMRYSQTYLNGLYLYTGAGANTYGTAYDTGIAVDDLNFRVMFEGILQANQSGGSQGLSPTVLEFTKANNEITFEGFTIKVDVANNNLTLSLKHSSIASGGQMLFAGVLKVVNTAGTGTSDSYYIYSNGLSFFKQLSTNLITAVKAVIKSTDTTALDVQNASGTSVFAVDTINQVVTGSAVDTTATANKLVKRDANGAITNSQYKLSALNTAPASATATGATGETRVTVNGIYYCTATNTWRKAIPVTVLTETITGLTSTFTNSTLPNVYHSNKYQWFITSGASGGVIESTHNFYAGNNILSMVTGATVQTVTANSVYSVRIGSSVLEIKFDIGSGAVSYRVTSGTATEITVNRLQQGVTW